MRAPTIVHSHFGEKPVRRKTNRQKVLIVCNELYWQYEWVSNIVNPVDLISAYSIEEAENHILNNKNIIVIVCVGDERFFDTEPLIRRIRKRFSGQIIALSRSREYRQKLIDAGCDFESQKWYLPKKLRLVLHDLSAKAGSR